MLKKIIFIYLPLIALLANIPCDATAQRKRSTRSRTTYSKKRTTKKNRTTSRKKSTKKDAFNSDIETAEINDLKSEKAKIQKEIAEKESSLRRNQTDVNKRLKKLVILNGEIADREKHIVKMQKDIDTLTSHIGILDNDIRRLLKQLKERKEHYAQSLRKMQILKGNRNDLQFIFSANSFKEMYRRIRYLKEYSAFQRIKGEEIKEKHLEVTKKKTELVNTKSEREVLLQQNEKEKTVLIGRKNDQQGVVKSLQAQQKEIKNALAEQRRKSAQLNRKIEQLIAAEIEKARKKAEEEARKARQRAEEEAKKRAAELAQKAPESSTKTNSGSANKYKDAEITTPFKYEDPDYKITGNFEHNKGRLPMPITGPYRIISHFGQYNVAGLKNVTLDNKGISIQGQAGAKARAVFDGVISAVFRFDGTIVVMVRHGGYISVYCNLSSVNVSRDQKVSAKQILGTVGTDHILQFQLRKGITKLNPEAWVR